MTTARKIVSDAPPAARGSSAGGTPEASAEERPDGPATARERSAVARLELLARWAPRIYGRAQGLTPAVQSSTKEAPQREDERPQEFHAAMAVHREFEALRAGEGCRHYSVLHVVYVEWGPIYRTQWKDLMGLLGWRFATPEQRKRWQAKRKSVASAAPRAYGRRLHDEAVAAFADLLSRT